MMTMTTRTGIFGLGALILGLGLGAWLNRGTPSGGHEHKAAPEHVETWICSMHPQIRMSGPGQCPICAMDLIPVAGADADEAPGPRQLRLSPTARTLASIHTAPVERSFVPIETRMVGKIAVDETRISHITAWVPGRIDRLYIDYTGVRVAEGDHMVYLYSPELLTAQEELIQALRARERLRASGNESMGQTARATVDAAREKLRLLGLKQRQIARIEREREASDHLTIYAPAGGVVVKKHLSQGAYVQTGTAIYTVADLSRLWLELAAYESDLPWVHYGQEVEYTTEALPGTVLTGRISFIDPVLDERTRTVRVRVNVANEDGRLKPGMLVRATVKTQVASDGRAMDSALAGKWISPMHPEIVRDGPGACDICGMALVRAEELGYALDADAGEAPLVIPASAPLVTGKRAVVYVALGEGLYEGREISLGARAGDFYLVREGLREGEEVVVNGAFKIDSALQIRAKPSMMNPHPANHKEHAHEGAVDHSGHERVSTEEALDEHSDYQAGNGTPNPVAFEIFTHSLEPVFEAYLDIQQALSKGGLHGAHSGAEALVQALAAVDMAMPQGSAHHDVWMDQAATMHKQATAIVAAVDVEAARRNFAVLSKTLTAIVHRFGPSAGDIHLFQCPMAFDYQGAQWLQRSANTANPYFGNAMYRCGNLLETFTSGE